MPLSKQFVDAKLTEQLPNIWEIRITYMYYSLYTYEHTRVVKGLDNAVRWLCSERCNGNLSVVNRANLYVDLLAPGETAKEINP
jgi:hypothetical protein